MNSQLANALFAGDFDLIVHQPAPAPTPSQPWGRLEEVLTSEDWAPEGEKMVPENVADSTTRPRRTITRGSRRS